MISGESWYHVMGAGNASYDMNFLILGLRMNEVCRVWKLNELEVGVGEEVYSSGMFDVCGSRKWNHVDGDW